MEPSVNQGSRPWTPSSAKKARRVPIAEKPAGPKTGMPLAAPAWMSATREVLASVPSVRQVSDPCVPSSARNQAEEPIAVISHGVEPFDPGWMSLTRTVPDSVPSEAQSLKPCVPSSARNSTFPLKASRVAGHEEAAPGLMSLTSAVPAAVPSLVQSRRRRCRRRRRRRADRRRRPTAGSPGCRPSRRSLDEPLPGLMSSISTVPGPVPSVFQLAAVDVVLGAQEDHTADPAPEAGSRPARPGPEILDQDGAGVGAVGGPARGRWPAGRRRSRGRHPTRTGWWERNLRDPGRRP